LDAQGAEIKAGVCGFTLHTKPKTPLQTAGAADAMFIPAMESSLLERPEWGALSFFGAMPLPPSAWPLAGNFSRLQRTTQILLLTIRHSRMEYDSYC
jgi:hypothetical protein